MGDREINCVDCKNDFILTESEQRFFMDKGLSVPKRCKDCRQIRREQKEQRENNNYGQGNY